MKKFVPHDGTGRLVFTEDSVLAYMRAGGLDHVAQPDEAVEPSPIPVCRSASWVARRLGVSAQWIHQLHAAGRLRGIKLPGVKQVDVDEGSPSGS